MPITKEDFIPYRDQNSVVNILDYLKEEFMCTNLPESDPLFKETYDALRKVMEKHEERKREEEVSEAGWTLGDDPIDIDLGLPEGEITILHYMDEDDPDFSLEPAEGATKVTSKEIFEALNEAAVEFGLLSEDMSECHTDHAYFEGLKRDDEETHVFEVQFGS